MKIDKERRSIWLGVSFSCLLLAFITYYLPIPKIVANFSGNPMVNGLHTDFTLSAVPMHSHLNQSTSWQTLQEKPLIISTGFTHCRHSCPMTMNFYQRLHQALKAEQTETNFVLFTVDRERDTPDRLQRFLAAINPEFIGLRADTVAGFNQVISELKQSVAAVGGDIDIAHSSNVYLFHPNVKGMIIYTRHDVDTILQDFKLLSSNI